MSEVNCLEEKVELALVDAMRADEDSPFGAHVYNGQPFQEGDEWEVMPGINGLPELYIWLADESIDYQTFLNQEYITFAINTLSAGKPVACIGNMGDTRIARGPMLRVRSWLRRYFSGYAARDLQERLSDRDRPFYEEEFTSMDFSREGQEFSNQQLFDDTATQPILLHSAEMAMRAKIPRR